MIITNIATMRKQLLGNYPKIYVSSSGVFRANGAA